MHRNQVSPTRIMHPETILQHLAEESHVKGAVTPPIFQTSLFVHDSVNELQANLSATEPLEDRYVYSRVGNPTNEIAEAKIAALEKTDKAFLFSSGMAAISAAILSVVKADDHIVCLDTCYGPTRQFLQDYLPKFNVKTTFVPGNTTEDILDAVTPQTSLIYLESPSSIIFRLQDFRAITTLAKQKGIKTITDNSYSSPLFQQPHTMGVDIVVHSATKYISGHSDVVAGVLCTSNELWQNIWRHEMPLLGAALPPFPAWLLLRGMRTLNLRIKQAQETGNILADTLKNHPAVEQVFHPSDPQNPQAGLYQSQMQGSTSLLSFLPKDQNPENLKQAIEALNYFRIGISWGGHESLATLLTYHPLDWPEPKQIIRLYAGLESPQDLQQDLIQALNTLI